MHADEGGKRQTRDKTLKSKTQQKAKREFHEWCAAEEARACERSGREDASAGFAMVPDYVSAFIDTKEKTKAIEGSTVQTYRTSLGYIRSEFRNTPVIALKAQAVEQWMVELAAAGYSSSTIGKAFRLLKQSMKAAVNSGIIDRNPLDSVKPPKRANKKTGINALDAQARASLIGHLGTLTAKQNNPFFVGNAEVTVSNLGHASAAMTLRYCI